MKTMYKLTNKNLQTRGGFQWVLGEERTTSGTGDLCGCGWLHCYSDPYLAVMLNPIHADIENPRLFLAEVKGMGKNDHGLKFGYSSMTLVDEIPLPEIATKERVMFAILCSLVVYHDKGFVNWAEGWLSGKDTSADSAAEAAHAARTAAKAAGLAEVTAWLTDTDAAARAAEVARIAANSAAEAARAAGLAEVIETITWEVNWAAAEAAVWAARAAESPIDLVALVHQACGVP